MSFSTIPSRTNGDDILYSWFDSLRDAGIDIESFLGGFIPETRFSLTNGQASPANITGLIFDKTLYTSAQIQAEINQKTASDELISNGTIIVVYRALSSSWDIVPANWYGDDPGITLSIDPTTGQLQYTLGTLSGTGYVGRIKFKAITFGI